MSEMAPEILETRDVSTRPSDQGQGGEKRVNGSTGSKCAHDDGERSSRRQHRKLLVELLMGPV